MYYVFFACLILNISIVSYCLKQLYYYLTFSEKQPFKFFIKILKKKRINVFFSSIFLIFTIVLLWISLIEIIICFFVCNNSLNLTLTSFFPLISILGIISAFVSTDKKTILEDYLKKYIYEKIKNSLRYNTKNQKILYLKNKDDGTFVVDELAFFPIDDRIIKNDLNLDKSKVNLEEMFFYLDGFRLTYSFNSSNLEKPISNKEITFRNYDQYYKAARKMQHLDITLVYAYSFEYENMLQEGKCNQKLCLNLRNNVLDIY